MAKMQRPQEKLPACLTREQMRNAIPKIERRIAELEQFNIDEIVDRYDPRIDAIERRIDDTLVEVLGHQTIDYDRYRINSLDHAPSIIGGIPLHEAKEGIKKGFLSAVTNLRSLIQTFQEKIGDSPEEPSARAGRTLDESNIHPELLSGIGKLFRDAHYANAVEDACKILEAFVKMRSLRSDLSGTDLMQNVFSPKQPVLQFNQLQTDTDRSEQQGMMFLYAGAMLAFRNPRAHSIRVDDPEKALEVILFINLLIKSLDGATRV